MTQRIAQILLITLLSSILSSSTQAKILRNNALMSKMVSNFHNDNDLSDLDVDKTEPILIRMQNVLCKNFLTIPCNIISQDKTLRKLIQKSIQQINSKKLYMDTTTPYPSYLTLFPIINNVNLSKHERRKGSQERVIKQKKYNEFAKMKEKSHEKRKKMTNKTKRTSVYGRKKLRKFYPHKVKYRDKARGKDDFEERSGERLSMSVEVPEMAIGRKHQHFSYKMQPADSPVWRIDYMKHGEPSYDVFGYNGGGKTLKTGPNVVVDDGRSDVLHPDVFLKKNFMKKSIDSDGVD